MSYISNTEEDRRIMLNALGLEHVEQLFDAVPESLRYPRLSIPEGKSELEVLRDMRAMSRRNEAGVEMVSFLGGGVYDHFIPSVVPFLSSRGEFATTYTPYQAEASQGTLQTIFEYQSMLASLYSVDVVNASHYDGSTAFAEAALMGLNNARKRSRVLLAPGVHPEYLEVLYTYTLPLDIRIDVIDETSWWNDPLQAVTSEMDENTAIFLVQTPDFFGRLSDLRGIADVVHERGGLFSVSADPVSLALYEPPGELGADIVTGDGQPLGIPASFGGPSLGIFGCTQKLVRKMPGRLVGEAQDDGGRRGFVLTLNTREQHIRRARATSNICTNQGLMALRSAIHLSALGPEGLREVATLCHNKSHYAAEMLSGVAGVSMYDTKPFFREFAVRLPVSAASVAEQLRERGILGGVDLGRYYDSMSDVLLIGVTEMRTREEIESLRDALSQVLAGQPAMAGGRS